VLINHPQGPLCEFRDNAQFDKKVVFPVEDGWRLPGPDDLTPQQEACLAIGQVYWPASRSCHHLLTQGPCGEDEWLVLDSDLDQVICRPRLCPCDPAMPDLCEVEMEDVEEGGCRCRVALAAAQDGICETGEQLLVSPSGYGVCGCIQNPVHVTMSGSEDNACYPLYHQGPCQPGFMVQLSRTRGEAVCGPALCGEGRVKWEDGDCYTLGDQGPCEDGDYLSVSSSSLEPQCFVKKVPRVYDMLPKNIGLITRAPVSRHMKLSDKCKMNRRRKCRKLYFPTKRNRNTDLFVKKSDPKKYLNWLKSFRKSG